MKTNIREFIFKNNSIFAEEVDLILDGKNISSSHIKVCETPKILRDIGVPNLPMLITSNHLKSITGICVNNRYNQHNIDRHTIKKLPESLSDPIAIMKSLTRDDSIVVLTELQDSNKKPIISAIKLDGVGRLNNKILSANIITSVYGKDNFISFLNKNLDKNTFLFISKEKSQALPLNPGVRFSSVVASLNCDFIIKLNASKVNNKEQTEEDIVMKTNSINVYEIDLNGKKYKVIPVIESYANNGTLAIDLVMYDSLMRDEFEIFGTLTKNIPDSMFLGTSIETIDNHAYIDGNRFGFEEFVIKNKLGEYQGKKGKSGYCEYPLFKFDLDRLNTEEAVEKWRDSIIVKRNKTFDIKITQTCQQDYKVEAKSKEEAIQIAESKYENGEFDPIQDEGEIEHSVCSLDEPAKILVDKDLFERMSNHLKNYEKDIQSIILDSEERYSYSEAGNIGDPENRRHWEHLEHYDHLKAEIHSLNKEIEENEENSLGEEEKDDFEV